MSKRRLSGCIEGFAGALIVALSVWGLAGCGGGRQPYDGSPNGASDVIVSPGRFYPPPGPPSDPWGPYIVRAAARFAIPPKWIRAVMRQESGGQQQAVSPVGAIGLMQLMPSTYAALRDQYGFGSDAFAPSDNILAGTAYLRAMYDRYGAPGFLAAYNAGPNRLDDYLAHGTPLPDETVGYLGAVAPELGVETALSGPLAVYASGGATHVTAVAPTRRSLAAGCDPDRAYDPEHPCRALEVAAVAPAQGQTLPTWNDVPAAAHGGVWAIQVGAFASERLARSMAERAAAQVPELRGAPIHVPSVVLSDGQVLYRARLVLLSQRVASLACMQLNARQLPCIVVRPDPYG